MDLFPKFIVEDGNVIISKCTFHKELVTDKEKLQGGGSYRYDSDKNSFTFYGESYDFGPAKIEDIQKAIEDDKVFTNAYLTHSIAKSHDFYYDTQSEIIKLN